MEDLKRVVFVGLAADFIAVLFDLMAVMTGEGILEIFMAAISLCLQLCAQLAFYNNYKKHKKGIFIVLSLMTFILMAVTVAIIIA